MTRWPLQTQRRRRRRRCFGQVLVGAGIACASVAAVSTLHAQDRSGTVQVRAGAALVAIQDFPPPL
jgi:hypothetical protein